MSSEVGIEVTAHMADALGAASIESTFEQHEVRRVVSLCGLGWLPPKPSHPLLRTDTSVARYQQTRWISLTLGFMFKPQGFYQSQRTDNPEWHHHILCSNHILCSPSTAIQPWPMAGKLVADTRYREVGLLAPLSMHFWVWVLFSSGDVSSQMFFRSPRKS